MAVPAIPEAGKPWLDWAQGVDAEARKVADKADATDLATVATSGAYGDLTGKPAIPTTAADIGAQPAGSYATTAALANGLATKIETAGVATIYVASSTASTAEKGLATATYTCDGTDDQVQIQAAIDAVKAAGGGSVLLSKGIFFLASPVQLAGSGTIFMGPHVTLKGAGMGATILRPLFNVSSALVLSARVQCDILDLQFLCFGSTSGIVSTASAAGTWAFWRSTFKNLYFEGSSDGNSTGWAMNLEGPFRSVFENIDAAGMVNGIRLYAAASGFFCGNLVFNRCFMLTYGSNGFGYKIDAATGTIINAIQFNLCEGFGDGGTGNTAVQLGGAGGTVNHTRWLTTNFESYDTVFRVVKGTGNVADGDYWDVRGAAAANAATLVQFDAGAYGNRVSAVTGHYTAIAHRLVVNAATDTTNPNVVENVSLTLDTGGAVTNVAGNAGTLITRNINAVGAGVSGASTVVKKFAPFAKVIHGASATIARPSADYVLWEGSVQPNNWIDGDDWNQV